MRSLRSWLMMCLTILAGSGCGQSPRAKLADLETQFAASHPAFTAHKGSMFLPVDEWEQAVRQCPDSEGWAARFLALAKAHPKSEAAQEALNQIIAYFPETTACKEAVEIYSRDYSQDFPNLCRALVQPVAPYGDHYFRKIIEESPNQQMRGQAMLARARFREKVMNDNATAEILLEQAVAQYADVGVWGGRSVTVGELAKDDLVDLRNPELVPKPLTAGLKAPPFETTTTEGKVVRFPDDYKGKVVLLDFWATWCGPCVQEVPNVVAAYERFHAQGLEVLSVSFDPENSGGLLASFVKKHKMTWPQIYEGKYVDSAIARRYSVEGIPEPIVIDGDTGLILAIGDDAHGENLAPAIAKALAAKRLAPK